jgi:DNA-directed RNA polymerase specialized sigma24 family protein
MSTVTKWILQLQAGEREAVAELWQAYSGRLVSLARRKLRGVPRAAADEEDVALSAFKSFCLRAEQGRFRRLLDRNDLWQILFLITARKAYKRMAYELSSKHGAGKVVQASGRAPAHDSQEGTPFADVVGREPDPRVAAEIGEAYGRMLAALPDTDLRAVAVWKLEGYSNTEIATKLGRAEVTVERKLRAIRTIWQKETPP